jgi:predicted permease
MRPERWMYTIPLRLRSLFRRQTVDRELNEELHYHVDLQTEENITKGMTPQEARRRARIELGGIEQVKQELRAVRTGAWLETLLQDIRFGFRMLRMNPGFTAVAVLTLALGIGANTAIFSMVDALVLRPLPVHAPREVVSFESHDKPGPSDEFSYPDFEDIRDQTTSIFSDVTGVQPFHMDGLTVNGQSELISTSFVTTNFFQVMGIQPALGEFFRPSEGKVGGSDPVLVLGYSFWKTHLGGDPSVVGRNILLNGRPVTIIGVAPKGFYGIFSIVDVQGYLPIGMAAATSDSKNDFLTDRKAGDTIIVGRLKAGVKLEETPPVLNLVARRLSEQYPVIHDRYSLRVFPVGPLGPGSSSGAQSSINAMAAFFLVLVGLVLVLACVNVANLLLVRATARKREIALRAALGAGRGRLVRQLLTESLLLALFGCAGGILLGLGASRLVGSVNFSTTAAIPFEFNFGFDWRIFAYAFSAALLTGLLVGIAPAIGAARGNLNDSLHGSSRSTTGRRQHARNVLVVAQLSGSLALLIVAGLFVRSLHAVELSDLGFDPNHVVTLSISPTEAGYNEPEARLFLQELLRRVRALPGVESASLAATVPLSYYTLGARGLKIEGYKPPSGQEPLSAGYNAVSSAYFETIHMPLIRGRAILDSDNQTSPYVAVINEEMAQRYWLHWDPLGNRFTLPDDPSHPIQVIGIAKNSHTASLSGSVYPYFYRPLAQDYQASVTLQVRTALPPANAIHETVGMIHSLAPTMPLFDVQSMTQALDNLNGLLLYRLGAALTASLGILGLLLALVGVYGVVSYAASQRTHEIGIRLALGAQPRQILQTVIGQGLIVTGAGILIGVLLASAIGSLARDFLSGVSPTDPITYVCASGLLASVALIACYIPAMRAMRVDPMVALRYE